MLVSLKHTVNHSHTSCKILLGGCPCKNRPLDFRSAKTEFLQIFIATQLVHMINKNSNNLAFNTIFQYFWRRFSWAVQNR